MGLTGENDTSDIENLIPRDARDSIRKKGNQVIEFENVADYCSDSFDVVHL